MNIGIDAYYLYSKNIDGLGNFLLRLMKQLTLLDDKNNYFLYTPGIVQKEYADSIFLKQNFTLREIKGSFRSRRRFWLQSPSLRKSIMNDNIDMFFGGGEYFPFLLPKKIFVASVIHDVAYRVVPGEISLTNKIFYYFLLPLFVKRANIFFTVSNNSKREIEKYLNIGNKKVIAIHNGIELKKFKPEKKG